MLMYTGDKISVCIVRDKGQFHDLESSIATDPIKFKKSAPIANKLMKIQRSLMVTVFSDAKYTLFVKFMPDTQTVKFDEFCEIVERWAFP